MAVSSLGCISIHFIKPGVKINSNDYWNTVLHQMLVPDIRYISGDTFVFQQDSALAHCTHTTVEFLVRDTRVHSIQAVATKLTGFEPNDYSVWEILQEWVYCTRVTNLEKLKWCLWTESAKIDHSITVARCRWRTHRTPLLTSINWHFINLQMDWTSPFNFVVFFDCLYDKKWNLCTDTHQTHPLQT